MANDQRTYKLKSMALESIMGNAKLSKIIEEGLTAPIGSTKRDKAKATISMIDKLISRNDGQGGVLMNFAQNNVDRNKTNLEQDNDYDQMVIFPSLPKRKTKQVVDDGQGAGWADYASSVWKDDPYYTRLPGYNPKVSPGLPAEAILGGSDLAKRTIQTGVSGVTAGDLGLLGLGEQAYKGIKNTLLGGYEYDKGPVPAFSETFGGKAYNKIFNTTTQATQNQPKVGLKTLPVGANNTSLKTLPADQSGNMSGQTIEGQTGGTTGGDSSYTTGAGNTLLTQLANQAPDAGTFWSMLASNPTLWKQVFGENSAAPKGASLAGQLGDLQLKLEKENGLDALRDKLTDMKRSGATLQTDLQDYIRGRDEYMTDIDNSIDATKQNIYSMDLGNPDNASSLNSYMSYLYTLKGRQNKRYVDMVNDSITAFNANYSNLNDEYNNVSNRVNKLFQIEGAITEEEYNRQYNAIASLYNRITDADGSASQLNLLKSQSISAQLQTIADMNKMMGVNNGVIGTSFLEQLGIKPTDFLDSKTGALDSNLNVGNLVSTLVNTIYDSKTGEKYSNDTASFLATSGLSKELASLSNDNDKLSTINKRLAELKELGSNQSIPGANILAYNIAQDYIKNASGSLKTYTTNNFSSIRSAIDQLTSSGWFSSKPKYNASNIQDWIDKNSTTVNKDLLTMIANTYLGMQSIDPNSVSAQMFLPGSDATSLGDQLANTFSNNSLKSLIL